MVCLLVCSYFLECLHGVSDKTVSVDSGMSETLPLSRQTLTSICCFVYTSMTRSIVIIVGCNTISETFKNILVS